MSRSRPLVSLLLVLPLAGFSSAGTTRTATPAADPWLVEICHYPDSQPPFTIQVAPEAVPAHMAQHGDTLGSCEGIPTVF